MILFPQRTQLLQAPPARFFPLTIAHRLVCGFMVYLLLFSADVLMLKILPFDGVLEVLCFLIFNALIALAIWAHLKTMLTDPGAVTLELDGEELEMIDKRYPQLRNGEYVTTCIPCKGYKPYRAHHCSTCQRCVRNMDHHCPWVNNCVGKYNQKFFVLFCAYICCVSWFAIGLIAAKILICQKQDWMGSCEQFYSTGSEIPLYTLCLLIEALLFGVFTFIMGCDQICGVAAATSTIDKLLRKGQPMRCSMILVFVWQSNNIFSNPLHI